ncbi:MAG TPA: YebC/PmpR family DNA-binding transcriptional regulator, partial [Chloroflexota bacterium]|nr:YebC/PmpR family DNA-binding transcriptional regulator [Chloroflexota bacterium]
EGSALEEITYEGYGPGGAAVMIQVVTDNRNRTVSELRHAFSRAGGSLGESGCVAWLFESRGIIEASADGRSSEDLALLAIDAGAEDVRTEEDVVEIYTDPTRLEDVRRSLENEQIPIQSAESTMLPKTTVDLADSEAEQVLKLIERLEELDDVQQVYSNVEFDDELMERYAG